MSMAEGGARGEGGRGEGSDHSRRWAVGVIYAAMDGSFGKPLRPGRRRPHGYDTSCGQAPSASAKAFVCFSMPWVPACSAPSKRARAPRTNGCAGRFAAHQSTTAWVQASRVLPSGAALAARTKTRPAAAAPPPQPGPHHSQTHPSGRSQTQSRRTRPATWGPAKESGTVPVTAALLFVLPAGMCTTHVPWRHARRRRQPAGTATRARTHLELGRGGDGRPLLGGHGGAAVEQPHKAAALLNLVCVCVGGGCGCARKRQRHAHTED